jgi:hypothetical protein
MHDIAQTMRVNIMRLFFLPDGFVIVSACLRIYSDNTIQFMIFLSLQPVFTFLFYCFFQKNVAQ